MTDPKARPETLNKPDSAGIGGGWEKYAIGKLTPAAASEGHKDDIDGMKQPQPEVIEGRGITAEWFESIGGLPVDEQPVELAVTIWEKDEHTRMAEDKGPFMHLVWSSADSALFLEVYDKDGKTLAAFELDVPSTQESALNILRALGQKITPRPAFQAPPKPEQVKPNSLNLDHDEARALHRIVRAMHDGECPKCHSVHPSDKMRFSRQIWKRPDETGWMCPTCRFAIYDDEAEAVFEIFAPFMERNLEVFEKWRKARS